MSAGIMRTHLIVMILVMVGLIVHVAVSQKVLERAPESATITVLYWSGDIAIILLGAQTLVFGAAWWNKRKEEKSEEAR